MSTSLSRLQAFYGDMDAESLLRAMIGHEFAGNIALLTSFGADAGVLLSMVAKIDPALPVLFLETGKHFPETLEYGRELITRLGLTQVHYLTPNEEMLTRIDSAGDLWKTQPNRCCWLRKVEPLNRAVKELGITALITGRKRYQTKDRAQMSTIEFSEDGLFRINPLCEWTRQDTENYSKIAGFPPHPLVARGYVSIGCEPCTLPVKEGDDERAGRWAHTTGLDEEKKVECGIHIPDAATQWSI